MLRLIPPALLNLLFCIAFSASSAGTTYYIAANGSDSNNGTSNSSAWAHAPGMPACKAACAAASPAPGDQFIFRGGDTWHFGNTSASPFVGLGGWNWSWGGSNGNPIYIGVDQTWYTGSSWVRPVMTGDNPLSTSYPSSCNFDESSLIFLKLHSVNYVTIDNFEWPGRCWNNGADSAVIYSDSSSNSNLLISNNYFHGWTAVLGGTDSQIYLGSGVAQSNNIWDHNVADGSDSSQGAGGSPACSRAYEPAMPCRDLTVIYQEMAIIRFSVFRQVADMAVTTNTVSAHDNLFEYLYDTYQSVGQHSNVLNEVVNTPGASTAFYNNIVRHTYVSQDIYLTVGSGGSAYVFNNVFYDNLLYDTSGDSAPSNCIHLQAQSSSGTQTLYFYNNTMDNDNDDPTGGGCQLQFMAAGAPTYAWNGPAYFSNNHLIGYGSLSRLYSCQSGANCSYTDRGNELIQATSTARSQGYTQSNNDAPASSSASTVGAGANQSSWCSTFSADKELCGGTSGGVTLQNAAGGEIANFPGLTMVSRASSWDAGAYQFGAVLPNAPTGLSAAVQ